MGEEQSCCTGQGHCYGEQIYDWVLEGEGEGREGGRERENDSCLVKTCRSEEAKGVKNGLITTQGHGDLWAWTAVKGHA